MKRTKKSQNFFDRYLDEIYDVSDMLQKEGHSRAECRYCEIMAIILLFLTNSVRTLRLYISGLGGMLLGLLLSRMLSELLSALGG